MHETTFTPPPTPITWEQLGILVLDASGSMYDTANKGNLTKAQALNHAVREVFTKFKTSRRREQFYFSNVYFGANAEKKLELTRADDLDDDADYDPFIQGINGGGTHIGLGLKKAKEITDEFLNKENFSGVPRTVVIVVLSDGMSEETETLSIASELKSNTKVTICTTLLEGKSSDIRANQLLQSIASDPVKNYKTSYDKDTIRDFFTRSVSSQGNTKVDI